MSQAVQKAALQASEGAAGGDTAAHYLTEVFKSIPTTLNMRTVFFTSNLYGKYLNNCAIDLLVRARSENNDARARTLKELESLEVKDPDVQKSITYAVDLFGGDALEETRVSYVLTNLGSATFAAEWGVQQLGALALCANAEVNLAKNIEWKHVIAGFRLVIYHSLMALVQDPEVKAVLDSMAYLLQESWGSGLVVEAIAWFRFGKGRFSQIPHHYTELIAPSLLAMNRKDLRSLDKELAKHGGEDYPQDFESDPRF